MVEQVLEKIEELVIELHTPDQDNVNEKYLDFIEALAVFLTEIGKMGYSVDINRDLEQIQRAVTIKDYIRLSDILLYTIRKYFVNLQKDLKDM